MTNYTYDALNRLIHIDYPASPSENIEFVYDYAGFADYSKGHLSYISSADGYVIVGAYDEYGNVGTKADWLSTVSSGFEYGYDNANRVISITYPSGRVVEYLRNAMGQIYEVHMRDSAGASPQTLISNVTYKPFGPLASLNFGNGVATTLSYDADYRVTRITATSTPNWDYSYGYDADGNIFSLTDQVGSNDRLYNYDTLHRLILDNKTTAGSLGQTEYQYDSGGNRILFKQGTGTSLSFTQTYASTSNRETQYGSQVMTPDAAGNLTGYGARIFTYDSANRMSLASVGSTNTTYRYNGLGQRTTKLVTTGGVTTTTHYDYDRDGKYLGQTQLNADGTYAQGDEYLWMDELPIAQVHTVYGTNNAIASQQLLYIHADNLNTPRAMTDATKKIVWKWESEAYGRAAPSTDPDGDGVQAKLDLRFPGQIADAETGFYYNMNRYYDPISGRYTQSDPIGLQGGENSYAYAANSPGYFVDPSGLYYSDANWASSPRLQNFGWRRVGDVGFGYYWRLYPPGIGIDGEKFSTSAHLHGELNCIIDGCSSDHFTVDVPLQKSFVVGVGIGWGNKLQTIKTIIEGVDTAAHIAAEINVEWAKLALAAADSPMVWCELMHLEQQAVQGIGRNNQ